MKTKTLFVFFFTITLIAAAFAVAVEENKDAAAVEENKDAAAVDENKGAAQIDIPGGYKGKVPFNHQMHQTQLKDCNVCHDLFPKAPGAIDDLKTKKTLKKKQVMNKVCIKCHKAEKNAGNKAGPTTCSKCHVK